MKIELIGINSSYVHTNLAIRQIKANCRHSLNISEYNINMDVDDVLSLICTKNADIVGFSCYIWNIEYVLRLCENLKKIAPKTIIVLGGPEVSFENQSYDSADYIITGEGEEAFNSFLDNYYEVSSEYAKIENLNNLKLYEEEYDPTKIYYYESTRGCPYSCTYCLSGSIGGYRGKDISLVKKEIKMFIDKGARLIKFVDRTFNADINRAKEIFKYIGENSKNTTFHFEVTLDLFDDELIEILKDSMGKIQLESGIQTTNKTTLAVVKRKSDVAKALNYAQKIPKDVHLHLDLIAGLPMENFMSFKKSFNEVFFVQPDNLQIGFLKVLKGSTLKKENRNIIYRHYSPYEVLKTDYLTAEELFAIKRLEYVFNVYYNKKKAVNALIFAIEKSAKTPFDFFYDFSVYYYNNEYNKRPQGIKEYYKILANYCKTILNEESYTDFLCKLKLDYMLANIKEDIQEFAEITPNKEFKQCYKEVKERGIFTSHILKNAVIGGFIKNPDTLLDGECIVVAHNNSFTIF